MALSQIEGLGLLAISIIATVGAVLYGILAYRADTSASPKDHWNAPARTSPISQADRLRQGSNREIARRLCRSRTYTTGLFWLCASSMAAASSTANPIRFGFAAAGATLFAGAVASSAYTELSLIRTRKSHVARANAVEALLTRARDPQQSLRTPLDQLTEWSTNEDLRVFILQRFDGPSTTTLQGRLVYETTGVGGWSIRAFDWNLGPVDSVSMIRGIALNLHFYSEADAYWTPGNGIFGASCHFSRYGINVGRLESGALTGNRNQVESLTIRIDDPFEIMPFL